MAAQISFSNAVYLGSIPGFPKRKKGNLIFEAGSFGIGILHPKALKVGTKSIATITVEGETVARSRVGKVILFGVAGLAAKDSSNATVVTLIDRAGNEAIFRIENERPSDVRAKVASWAHENGVVFSDQALHAVPVPRAPAVVIAPTVSGTPEERKAQLAARYEELRAAGTSTEQLGQLLALRDAGTLSQEEYVAAVSRLAKGQGSPGSN